MDELVCYKYLTSGSILTSERPTQLTQTNSTGKKWTSDRLTSCLLAAVAVLALVRMVGLEHDQVTHVPYKIDRQEKELESKLKNLGPDAKATDKYQIQMELAELYHSACMWDKASTQYDQALLLIDPNQHEELAACLTKIGDLYKDSGDFAKAKEKYEEALKARRQDNNVVGVSKSLADLGAMYLTQGRYSDKLPVKQFSFDKARQLLAEANENLTNANAKNPELRQLIRNYKALLDIETEKFDQLHKDMHDLELWKGG